MYPIFPQFLTMTKRLFIPKNDTVDIKLTYDECYQMVKLYDLIRDMDIEIDPLIDSSFLKIMEAK